MSLRAKRIYEALEASDGSRILVDRLWPRGVSKERAALDLWLPEVGPSHALRRWFGHRPEHWREFVERYHAELRGNDCALAPIRERLERGTVTLLYSARDEKHNQAVALMRYLDVSE